MNGSPESGGEWVHRGNPLPFHRLLRLLLPFLLLTHVLSAQDQDPAPGDASSPDPEATPLFEVFREFRAGIMIGPQWRRLSTDFSVKPGTDSCGRYDGGTTRSASFTLLFDIVPEFLPTFWMPIRLSRVDRSTTLVSGPRVQPARAPSGELIDVTTQNELEIRASGFSVAIGGGWQLGNVVRVGVAPTITLQSVEAVRNLESIVSPLEARFPENDESTRPFRQGREVLIRPIVPGVDFLAAGRFELGPFIAVHPEFRVGIPLTDNATDVAWREFEVESRIGVSIDLASRSMLSDTTSVDTLPAGSSRPILTASITAFGLNDAGERYDNPVIEIEETPWTESVPLIPYLFFDSASAQLPPRYHLFRDRASVTGFSVDSLLSVSPLDIHWQMLNVLGRRMMENPEATLTVVGNVSGDEVAGGGASLGRSRAEQVVRYLSLVCGIDPTRLTSAFTLRSAAASPEENVEGREENRRVELHFNDNTMVRPVVVRRTATVASPPSVKFVPEISADTTVAEWYISIVQGDRELLRFHGTATTASLRQQKEWSLSELRVQRDTTPIRYRLTVSDVTGQRATSEGSFRVMERPGRRQVDSLGRTYEVIEHSLVGFGYNSSELLSEHLTQISELAGSLPSSAAVSIIGYTDRVGDPERNRNLSRERADRVLEALRTSRVRRGRPPLGSLSIEGLGSERELFNNNIPEGRLLSRMVRMTSVIPSAR